MRFIMRRWAGGPFSWPRRAGLLLALLLPLTASAEPPRYRVISGYAVRPAYGMNHFATLAGSEIDQATSRVYPAIGTPSVFRRLPALMAGGEGRAVAINDRGEVAGHAMTPAPPPFETGLVAHAWYWSEATGPIDLTPDISGASFARAINNSGMIVGDRMEGPNSGPFIWRVGAGGVVEERRIGSPDITSNDTYDVNELGVVVGTQFNHGWVYDAERGLLEILPESGRGGAYGINDRNEIVGYVRDPEFVPRAALWRRVDGQWRLFDLGALPDPNRSCAAIEINNAGTVIGECIGPSGVPSRYFVHAGSELTPIERLVADPRWSVVGLYDINEAGQILAAARFEGAPAVAVVLDPIARRPRPVRR